MPKRFNYEISFKLKVIQYAFEHGNRAAGRQFDVNEKLVRDWIKLKDKFEASKKTKRALRGPKHGHWEALETELVEFINDKRADLQAVSRQRVKFHARRLAREHGLTNFKGGSSWCTRFMRRHGISIRARTRISQKLPEDYEDKLMEFQKFVIKHRKQKDYDLSQMGNMDEVPTFFDMPPTKTLNKIGEKTIQIKTTGHEKSHFTTVLACMADGHKLKPMLIFKRKTMPKEKVTNRVVVHVQEKGWMNEHGMLLWVEKIWNRRPGGLLRRKALLVFDAFSGHLHETVRKSLQKQRTDIAVIPGGLTSMLQPLDVSVNRVFKDRLREQWSAWLESDKTEVTAAGNLRRPSIPDVCEWVANAWDDIHERIIIKAFKKCCISNAMDGSEDDILFDDMCATQASRARAVARARDAGEIDVPAIDIYDGDTDVEEDNSNKMDCSDSDNSDHSDNSDDSDELDIYDEADQISVDNEWRKFFDDKSDSEFEGFTEADLYKSDSEFEGFTEADL